MMLEHAPQVAPRTLSPTDSREEGSRLCFIQADQVSLLRRNQLGRHAIEFERHIHREAREPLGGR